jgi:hypothetical protein
VDWSFKFLTVHCRIRISASGVRLANNQRPVSESVTTESVPALKLLEWRYNVPPPTTIHLWAVYPLGEKLLSSTTVVPISSILPDVKMCAAFEAA